MKRVTAILALFAIVGMVFAAGCSDSSTAPAEGGAPPAGKAAEGGDKMAPAPDAGKAPAGAPAPPGPGK